MRDVCDAKVAPYAAEVDEQARYPQEASAALLAADFHAPHVPEEYGGAGADALATVLVIEEVARVCMSSSLIPAVNKLGSLPVHAGRLGGAEEELPDQARGGARWLLVLPLRAGGGQRRRGMRTTAVRDGDHWVLNGVKRWITNAGGLGVLHGHGGHRPRRAGQKRASSRLRGREVRRGRLVRGAGEEARHQGLARPGRSTSTTCGSPPTG